MPSPTDPITLYTTHSTRWLVQLVCQVIRAVRWKREFTCDGVSSLAEFSSVVNELEALDPVSCAIHAANRGLLVRRQVNCPPGSVVPFAKKLDVLLVLLDETADALAAEWDLREKMMPGPEFGGGNDPGPAIQ